MKNLLKLSALAIAVMSSASLAGAQASKTATLAATAKVGADIRVVGTDFTFGSIYRNNGPVTVDEKGGGAGYFVIDGTGASTPSATLSVPSVLHTATATVGVTDLPVIFAFAQVPAATGNCTTAFTSGSQITLGGSAGGAGSAKLCVGGTVTPGATQAIATDYTGTVTVTVAFP